MTPTQTAPAPPALADLVLVRMILTSNTPKKVRDDVGTVFDSGLSEGTFDEIREGLTAAGLTLGRKMSHDRRNLSHPASSKQYSSSAIILIAVF